MFVLFFMILFVNARCRHLLYYNPLVLKTRFMETLGGFYMLKGKKLLWSLLFATLLICAACDDESAKEKTLDVDYKIVVDDKLDKRNEREILVTSEASNKKDYEAITEEVMDQYERGSLVEEGTFHSLKNFFLLPIMMRYVNLTCMEYTSNIYDKSLLSNDRNFIYLLFIIYVMVQYVN